MKCINFINSIFIYLFIFIFIGINSGYAASGKTLSQFSAIDAHALKTPASAEKSLESLAEYLKKPAKNDLEKARAIFIWITDNIAYDMEGYRSGNRGDLSPNGVLKSRLSVCAGYAGLFKQLGDLIGLNVATISGYSKGAGYYIGKKFNKVDHAWNAVEIDKKWYLLDATWAAGRGLKNGKWEKAFNDYYFLTPPEEFIYTHLPKNSKWQLLDTPISMGKYQEMVYLKSGFFKNGLKLNSHTKSIIETDSQLKMTIIGDEDTIIVAYLLKKGKKLEKFYTFAQKSGRKIEINAVFPKIDTYTLRIFAKRKGDTGLYHTALDYKIKASKKADGKIGFPLTYNVFNEKGAYVFSPVTKYLSKSSLHNFEIKVPNALKVAVRENDEWHHLNKEGDIFKRKLKVGKGKVMLFAKFPGQKNYSGLLQYTGY
jgi:transglutaminase/protease-like cytokinesis protein 3